MYVLGTIDIMKAHAQSCNFPTSTPLSSVIVSPDEMQAARNAIVSTYLRPVATGLGVLYVVLALLHPFVVPAPSWPLLTTVAGVTALLLLLLRHYLGHTAIPAQWVHLVAGCIIVLVLGNSLLHVALVAEPQQSTNVALTILSASCLLMNRRVLTIMMVSGLLCWSAIAVYHVDAASAELWLHFAFLLIETVVIAWLIHAARCRTFDHLTRLRSQDAMQASRLSEAMSAARENEARAQCLAEATFEGILIHDQGRIVDANAALAAMVGYPQHELIGRIVLDVVAEQSHSQLLHYMQNDAPPPYEILACRRDGTYFPAAVHVKTIFYGGRLMLAAAIRDLTEQKQAEATIAQMAYYDALTELPNRRLFLDRLRTSLAHARRHEYEVTVLFLDLNRFKVINDTLGHAAGDQLLRHVAQRLTACVREADSVARMGGDEFTILLPAPYGTEDIHSVAQRIWTTIAEPLWIDGHELVVQPSIGIACYPRDGRDADELLRHADTAMYRAKMSGNNFLQEFTPTMALAAKQRLVLEMDLRQALQQGEFTLHYQPRVDAISGEVRSLEALVRWCHPERGLIAPSEFIAIAEETGLIVPLGAWVLNTACAQLKLWQDAGYCVSIAVNLSARQFQDPELVTQVADVLSRVGIKPEDLELEITETTAMRHAQATLSVLRALKAMNVQIAIDDFGTGYSSLSYLKQFPVDRLKLDRSFVSEVVESVQDAAIVTSIISLAHSLRMSVTAEGVETDSQRVFLQQRGCDELQGYLISRPEPVDAVTERLQSWHRGIRIVEAPTNLIAT